MLSAKVFPTLLFTMSAMICAQSFALSVDTGLSPYQVIQCDDAGLAAVALTGVSTANGAVQARVTGVQKEILPWTEIARAENGKWAGTLASVPAGGPYRVDFRVCDASGKALESGSVSEVLVGDVWVLAGQSNMQGVGNQKDMETPHPQVHTFSMSYEWRIAQEPLHTLAESPDSVHANFASDEERQNAIKAWRDGSKGAGLGLPFAVEMVKRTGRPVGLVAAAHGGTSMQQWDPSKKGDGGASLYGSMCKQVAAAGGKVRGVLWYQGESDANPDAQPLYRERFKQLVAAMRTDFNAPNLPFYYVQIGRFVINNDKPGAWNAVQTDELALESELAPGGMVASIDLALDDLIHAGTPGLKTLGFRLANLAERDLFGKPFQAGPRFEKVDVVGTPFGRQLRVKFASVNGALKAAGRPNGFSISSKADGADVPCIYNMEIAKDDPSVVILWVQEFPEDPFLWYGRGFNPYCNIADEADMAMPVMGPIQLPPTK